MVIIVGYLMLLLPLFILLRGALAAIESNFAIL